MKNYRLIKEYPGSPKLGHIDELNKSGHNNQGEYVQAMYDRNPEFWEEVVVEKDYEILSLVASERNPQHKKGSKFLHNKDYKFKNMHPTEFWDIYSVKRISDNKIFTIGDSYEDLIIEKMFMSVDGNILTTYIPKAKQPLFTTEDGVDIFEGSEYYPVNPLYVYCGKHIARLAKTIDRTNHWETTRNYLKFFSTKEDAEEYIVNNIPIISLNDFHKICNDYSKPRGIDERLKEFVISKLKQSSFSC